MCQYYYYVHPACGHSSNEIRTALCPAASQNGTPCERQGRPERVMRDEPCPGCLDRRQGDEFEIGYPAEVYGGGDADGSEQQHGMRDDASMRHDGHTAGLPQEAADDDEGEEDDDEEDGEGAGDGEEDGEEEADEADEYEVVHEGAAARPSHGSDDHLDVPDSTAIDAATQHFWEQEHQKKFNEEMQRGLKASMEAGHPNDDELLEQAKHLSLQDVELEQAKRLSLQDVDFEQARQLSLQDAEGHEQYLINKAREESLMLAYQTFNRRRAAGQADDARATVGEASGPAQSQRASIRHVDDEADTASRAGSHRTARQRPPLAANARPSEPMSPGTAARQHWSQPGPQQIPQRLGRAPDLSSANDAPPLPYLTEAGWNFPVRPLRSSNSPVATIRRTMSNQGVEEQARQHLFDERYPNRAHDDLHSHNEEDEAEDDDG